MARSLAILHLSSGLERPSMGWLWRDGCRRRGEGEHPDSEGTCLDSAGPSPREWAADDAEWVELVVGPRDGELMCPDTFVLNPYVPLILPIDML